MISVSKLKEVIKEAILEYNRYRVPEVKAKLISVNDNMIEVKFEGTFCYTCGFYDYFEDYAIILEEKGINIEIDEVQEAEDGGIVRFRITKLIN